MLKVKYGIVLCIITQPLHRKLIVRPIAEWSIVMNIGHICMSVSLTLSVCLHTFQELRVQTSCTTFSAHVCLYAVMTQSFSFSALPVFWMVSFAQRHAGDAKLENDVALLFWICEPRTEMSRLARSLSSG